MDDDQLFIIAIGASAGGMEAIHCLFDHTPEDGVAYVIIQHLSPNHKSFMAELLAKHSKLQISIAENNMYVEPNRVYLMPKGKNMTIEDRRLKLSNIQARQPNTAIDIFFNSLAKHSGEKSIAVILSGTGSDGTKGISAIKQRGGFVIVQDPESSKFDGMPNSAIGTGDVDVICKPELIPDEIIAHLNQNSLVSNFNNQITEKDEAELVKILNLIQEHTPFDFSEYKRPTIIRRIVKRMTKNNISSLSEYTHFLQTNNSEIDILIKEFLISVTKFFRDKESFETIKEKALKEIIENKLEVETLKIWVVGCATGEEAYSLAILILEELAEAKKDLEVKIFASDIDKSALQHASKGIYSENIANDVSQERLDKFFIKEDNKYKVRDNIRKMIIFAEHDIIKHPPYGKIDLISCRNLLIYINPILQQRILASLHFCLNLGGYLFLGPSESLGKLKEFFVQVDKKWKIYKSIESVRNLRNTTYSTPGIQRKTKNLVSFPTPQKSFTKGNQTESAIQTLLEESGFQAGIWVDVNFQIVQTFGDFEKFLLPKIFNFNLLEMLPEELAIAISTSLKKAVNTNKKTLINKVKFRKDDKSQSANLLVKPFLSEEDSTQNIVLILLSGEKIKESTSVDSEVFDIEKYTARYWKDMEKELAETKVKLGEVLEELEISNNDISLYNEELISGNEELQSTNEELQSVNEELQTINNEYQLKIREFAELNDDLNNYFRSTINAQIYVDHNLILRKFTPSAIAQINLKESDLGRPLSDISTNIRFSTLTDDIAKVNSTTSTVGKEIQTLDDKWYQMIAMPYFEERSDQSGGVIINFNDITELKKVQHKLSRINEDHDTFIYSVSHDLKGPINNLRSLITLLKESVEISSEEDREILDMINFSTANLGSIINELSDIVKIEKEFNELENINLQDMLKEIEASMKDILISSNAKIQLDLEVPEIRFSKKNMRSIITNILSNAVKYRDPLRDPEITISTKTVGQSIMLSIKDNGLGIPENKQHEIFARFKRAHKHVEGTGVGLYLVKKIINLSGGDIEVESELGKGSTFKVYFN